MSAMKDNSQGVQVDLTPLDVGTQTPNYAWPPPSDFLGSEDRYQPLVDSIFAGLGVGPCSGVILKSDYPEFFRPLRGSTPISG